jgi:hypothetical protein
VTLAEAHILLQAKLRGFTKQAIAEVWRSLPAHNTENLDEWVARVVPVVLAAQRQSVHLTDAYLARAMNREPLGVNPDDLIGAKVRNGTSPEEVYKRPFIATWAALGAGTALGAALDTGEARATSSGAMDVQLSMRATLTAVGGMDEQIVGYVRVPDGGACALCEALAGSFSSSDNLMPIHNNCGCGAEPVSRMVHTAGEPDMTFDGVTAAIRDHGELGPVLVDASQHFTSEHELHH